MTDLLAGPTLLLPGDADHDEWLERRRQGIGSSDIAAILGISPWQGPLHVWLDKLGQLNWAGNAATKWGSRFEDDVLEEFIEAHPELVVTPKSGTFADPSAPWRLASLDAEAVGEDGLSVVEIKTGQGRRAGDEWGEPGTDEIPLYYLTQVTWACDIRQASRWRLAYLPLDDLENYREYEGDFSPELAAQLRERVAAWRDRHLIAGIEPTADGLVDTTEILTGRRIQTETVEQAELPADALLWQAGYRTNHRAIAEFEAAKNEYGNLLRQALIAAKAQEGLVNGEVVATWKLTKAGKPSFRVKGV